MRGLKERSLEELLNDLQILQSGGNGERELRTEVDETRRLVHELQIHQVELEMQNRELREAQGLLEESRARYVELYDRAPVGYLTIDHHGVIQEINLTGASLIGKERSRLIGHRFRNLLAPGSPPAFDAHLRLCLQRDQPAAVELTFKGPEERVVELMSVAVHDKAGAAATCHTAMTDVSERRRTDLERAGLLAREREARALAEKAIRIREDFLAVVSHELRTPLAPMMMWMRVLRTAADTSLQATALATLDTCLKAQVRLIDDLVDLARSKNGKLRVDRRPMNLAPVLEAEIEALAPSAAAKQIKVSTFIEASSCSISGDPARLRQVIANLLSNAIKFTPAEGNVAVSLKQAGEHAVLDIEDDGEGIDAALLPQVFEPFRQEDGTPVRRHGGLGLGLSIVRELVWLHSGTVTAQSRGKGLGAKLTVTLPLNSSEALALAGPRWPAGADRDALEGLSILVIEDQPQTREAVTIILKHAGAAVVAAASAREGRAVLAKQPVDVILCDIAMPDEDGYTFVRALRAQEAAAAAAGGGGQRPGKAGVATVALTAHTMPDDRGRALQAGFDLHVAKPVDPDELVAILSRWRKGGGEDG
jgi:PAS domain S-box-containing protein